MTVFKVGDTVTPKNERELSWVTSQLHSKGRKLPSPPYFKVERVGTLGYDGSLILYYECGYHSYASRMQLINPLDKPLEDYL